MLSTSHFDAAKILAGLIPWVEVESPTYDSAAVNRMMDLAAEDMLQLGARVERIAGADGLGDIVIARLDGREPTNDRGILILSHLDTIHLAGTLASKLRLRRDGDKYYGPGIYDMKGGVRIAIEALSVIRAAGVGSRLPITYMFVPDEEIGSPSSRKHIEAEARRAKYVLVTEPCKNGVIVTGRYAFQRFWLKVDGRPAHAGANNRLGRSAIRAMARLVEKVESMSDFERGITFSVGRISGGTFVNVMPIECRAEILTVAPNMALYHEIGERLRALEGETDGTRVTLEAGPVRPLWEPNRDTLALFDRARAIAGDIGFELRHGSFGGGSDGNFTGALGVATLDGLGVDGAGAHTFEEHLLVSSLVPRCRMFAELLATLD